MSVFISEHMHCRKMKFIPQEIWETPCFCAACITHQVFHITFGVGTDLIKYNAGSQHVLHSHISCK